MGDYPWPGMGEPQKSLRMSDAVLGPLKTNMRAAMNVKDDTPEVLVRKLELAASLKRAVNEFEKNLKAAIAEEVGETGFVVPGTEIVYRLGRDKTVSCVDKSKAFNAILEAVGGDLDLAVECLGLNCVKPGAAGKVLEPAVFDRLFVVTMSEPKLVRRDPAYAKGKGNGRDSKE